MSNEVQETVADIVSEMRRLNPEIFLVSKWCRAPMPNKMRSYADRIEAAAKRGDDVWRAAFAKVTFVVSRQHAKRNLGEQWSMAVAEIMSVCRFPDGALDEYERAFAENARLRAALKPVLEVYPSYEDGTPIQLCDGEVSTDSEYGVSVNGKPIDDHTLAGCLAAVREAQCIYDGSKESEVK